MPIYCLLGGEAYMRASDWLGFEGPFTSRAYPPAPPSVSPGSLPPAAKWSLHYPLLQRLWLCPPGSGPR